MIASDLVRGLTLKQLNKLCEIYELQATFEHGKLKKIERV